MDWGIEGVSQIQNSLPYWRICLLARWYRAWNPEIKCPKMMRLFKQLSPCDPRRRFSLKKVDPCIHFALVCGSRSCAPIRFYTPGGIYDELELATTNFINSSEVIVIPEEKKTIASMIFRWHEKDFGGKKGVLDFIEKYLVDDVTFVVIKLNS